MERKIMVEVTQEELKRVENFGKETLDDLVEILSNYMARPNCTSNHYFDKYTGSETIIKTFENKNYRVDFTVDSSNELNIRILQLK